MKIGILISGRGSNMVALVDAVKSGEIPDSEISVVISDNPAAAGIAKARERGLETLVVERRGRNREEHDAEMIAELKARDVELVCLAGYMRLLSPSFIEAFPNKIINIHPSLLPKFPGLEVHERVLAAGETVSGCTVHYVNEDLDAGEVILQREVPVLPGDTAETLAARILDEEHGAYVEAVRRLVTGRIPSSDAPRDLIGILDIGLETSFDGKGISLKEALQRTDYANRRKSFQSSDLVAIIRENLFYIDEWLHYSEDKRTDGGWWILDEPPPRIGNLKTRDKISFGSMEEAVAEYVIREMDFWANLN